MNKAYVEDPIKYSKALLEIKYQCKKCGHKIVIPHHKPKKLCSWCGHWVYADARLEFKEKFKETKKRRD